MKKIFILSFLLFCSFVSAAEQSKDIRLQSENLSKFKKSIKEKEQEKNNFIHQERIFKGEVKYIKDSIGKTEKKLAKLSTDIKKSQHDFENFSKVYNAASSRSDAWNQSVLDDMKLFNKMTFLFSYEQNPVEYKIMRKSLEHKKVNFEKEKKSAEISEMNMKKCEKSKKNLLNTQQKENEIVGHHKNMLKEKNELLGIVSNRRLAAEREIKVLTEKARELQKLINKINDTIKKKRVTVRRKKSFSWPVNGKVVAGFGKNKHPDLDVYIISNGIKIAAADFSHVKSVESGIVVFSGRFGSYGKIIIIDHGDSNLCVYGFLDKTFVRVKQKVSRNTVIAELGSGGNNILYFEIRHNNIPDDPMLWLQAK
jgi:septal ring factor EnvC (AmiA/AmiB activator)